MKAIPVKPNWHSDLPIYASEAFAKSREHRFGWMGGGDAGRSLRCILPYSEIRKFGFRLIRFGTGTIPLGNDLELDDEKLFLNNVVEYFRSDGADMIIPSGNTAIFRTYPDGAVAAPYATYVKNLEQSEERLSGEIRKTFRQNIRKAAEQGVEIKSGMEYLDLSYAMIRDTMKRSGASFKPYSYFSRTILSLGKNVRIFVAEHQKTVQACMFAPFSQCCAYNCYAGTKEEPTLGSMHLLHWEAIRQFRAMGVKKFDFQGVRVDPERGSKQEGIANYKKGFGGEFLRGFTWKFSLRPLKAVAYSLAVRVLMDGDIVDKEGHKLLRDSN